MQLSKHYVQQTGFIQKQNFTLHSSVNILAAKDKQLTKIAYLLFVRYLFGICSVFLRYFFDTCSLFVTEQIPIIYRLSFK
jgi:hypothetical protein